MGESIRLARLTLAAKLLVTLFLLIVGPGYLFGTANIFFKHQYADDKPGLSLDDLRATFHGMERTFQPGDKEIVNSEMLTQIRPDGDMREYLEEGGEPAIRGLTAWLEKKSPEDEFDRAGLCRKGTHRPRQSSRHIVSNVTTPMAAIVKTYRMPRLRRANRNTRW